jgi:hypothetical protein
MALKHANWCRLKHVASHKHLLYNFVISYWYLGTGTRWRNHACFKVDILTLAWNFVENFIRVFMLSVVDLRNINTFKGLKTISLCLQSPKNCVAKNVITTKREGAKSESKKLSGYFISHFGIIGEERKAHTIYDTVAFLLNLTRETKKHHIATF